MLGYAHVIPWMFRPVLALAGRGLRQQAGKKLRWIHAVRRIVRAGIDATRLGVVVAQITGRGFYAHASDLVSGMYGVVEFRREGM